MHGYVSLYWVWVCPMINMYEFTKNKFINMSRVGPGQNKRIVTLSLFYGYRKRRLKDL
jgi:hypothetical protein